MKDEKLVKELYNKQFKKYSKEQTKYRVIQDLRRKIYNLLGNIKNKKILFAGCGDGRECLPAIRKKAKVFGIDISEIAIEFARKNCPKGKFYVRNFEETGFSKGFFDMVISILSLMYKKNIVPVLKEFKRVLKPKGSIILVVPHPVRKMIKYNNLNYFIKGKKWENWRGIKRFNYYRLFEDYFDAFIKAGLKVVKLKEPKPVKETKKTPDTEINHPHFLIFKLVKD